MSFGGHRVVPFTHAYRGPGIGAAFKGVAVRTFDEDHSGYIGREELEHGIHTERNAVEDPILSFPDPNHVGNAHLHINRHPEMR